MNSDNLVLINTVQPTDQFDTTLSTIKALHPAINSFFAHDFYLRGSDHTPFFNKKIPVVSFTTGIHDEYHTPADTIGLINFEGQKLLLDFVYDFILKEAGR
jgi:aminopeptidase-like protein